MRVNNRQLGQRTLRGLFQGLILITLIHTAFAYADTTNNLPRITGHSELSFSVYHGDRINLAVTTNDDEQNTIKWLTRDELLCRSVSCEIDTSQWDIGTYFITLVVLNNKGSSTLRYAIRVLETPLDRRPKSVKPRWIEADNAGEIASADDLLVRTVKGRGFSYHKRKLQVVGKLARALEWREKLKTQVDAQMQFGRLGIESHTMLAETSVELAASESGRRAIYLRKGVLRSRQLNGESPRWSILVDDWLQIDGDHLADLLITKTSEKSDKIQIVVLRGAARIFQKPSKKTDIDTKLGEDPVNGEVHYIPAGLSQSFSRDKDPGIASVPSAKEIGKQVRSTTPFLSRGQTLGKEYADQAVVKGSAPVDVTAALNSAATLHAAADWIATIEILAPFASDLKTNYAGTLMLADAYRGIFLYGDAFFYYKTAAQLKPDAAEPVFAIGSMYLSDRQWRKALRYLERAEDLEHPDKQTLHYYLGVANYRLNQQLTASNHFEYSLWNDNDPELAQSARAFLANTTKDDWFDLRLSAELFFDSNPLHASPAALKLRTPTAINSVPTRGYAGAAGFSLWAINTPQARLGMYFDIMKTRYLNPELVALEPIDQSLGFNFHLGIGGKSTVRPLLSLDGDAQVQMLFVGEERAVDRLATQVLIASPALFGAKFGILSELLNDPIPMRDDIFDPSIEAVVPPSERTHRRLSYIFGLTPWSDNLIELALTGTTSEARYRNSLRRDEDFTEQKASLNMLYKAHHRHQLGIDSYIRRRKFAPSPSASERRHEQNAAVKFFWQMRYTASLTGSLSASKEKQSSNSAVQQYGREVYSYGLKLDF